MSFASESGYTPNSVAELMEFVRQNVNATFGTDFTAETFVGTNWYKFYYAIVQKLQENEVLMSEVFIKLQEFVAVTNERISRPVATSPGIIEKLGEEGYVASVKPMLEADAGKISICVDVVDNHARGLVEITGYANLVSGTADKVTVNGQDFTAQSGAATPGDNFFQAATSNVATAASLANQINAHPTIGDLVEAFANGAVVTIRSLLPGTAGNAYTLAYTSNTSVGATISGATLSGGFVSEDDYDDMKLEICEIIKDSIAGGVVTQGEEVETLVLSNGQAFDFRFFLPDRKETLLRLTTTLSENNELVIGSPEEVKEKLLENVQARYRLGKNFEPQKYFAVSDAPWCSQVLLEYSINNGADWFSTIYDANFDDLLEISLENIELVEE